MAKKAVVKNAIPANYDNLRRKFHYFETAEQELYILACMALFEAINHGFLVASDKEGGTFGRELIEASYLVQDVVNSCDRARYGEALAAVCEVSHD